MCMCVCACVCKGARESVCAPCVCVPVHVCACACVCAFVRLCISAALLLHESIAACIHVNFISCITTECQCSANCLILWGQTNVCEFCMAASPCSCAPLPLAQPGPLLLAAGGRGLGGKVQAEWGGASSLLVTLNNNYFSLPIP